jgi:cell division septal protein FtsQ
VAAAQKSEARARAQVVTPRTSRKINRSRSRKSKAGAANIGNAFKSAATLAKPAALLAVVVVMIVAYQALANSQLFEVRAIEVSNAGPALSQDVEQVVRRAVGQTKLLAVDLGAVRHKVEQLPRVSRATVSRVLPDSIHVRVEERKPTVLVRRESGALVWFDADAVEMGEFSELKGGEGREIPPIAKGFAEDTRSQAAISENRERITLYKQIEREFSEAPNPVWNLVDEIDLTFTKDVNLRMANPAVTVHIGSKDFRNRFEMALQILGAIQRGDGELLSRFRVADVERLIENADHINFIDAARPDRIVLNFATPGTQNAVRQEAKSR